MSLSSDRPPPPIVGKVTETTIQLYWNPMLGHPRYCIQEFDTSKSSEPAFGSLLMLEADWGNVYSGSNVDTTITNLDPQNMYRFRLRAIYDDNATPWSPVVTVTTTRTGACTCSSRCRQGDLW